MDSAYIEGLQEVAQLEDDSIVLMPIAENDKDTDKVYYPTQFLTLNLATGKNIRNEKGEIISAPRGIRSGAFILMSGRQSIGKTTLALNITGHLKKTADAHAKRARIRGRSEIIYMTTEDGMEEQSLLKNCYLDKTAKDTGEFRIIKPENTSTEEVGGKIDAICAYKEKNKDELMCLQPCVGGGFKMEYLPTFLFIDSLTGLAPQVLKTKDNDKQDNMWYAKRNKENSMMIINKFDMLRKYNIITVWIVHCGMKFSTNGLPNQKDYQSLSADIKVSDGKTPQFYADLFLYIDKITDSDSKAKNIQDILGVEDNFIGYGVQCLTPKNRWGDNSIRSVFRLVFDYTIGWNPYYSMLYELASHDILINAGSKKRLPGYDKTFSKSDIPALLKEDREFTEALKNAFESKFEWLLEAQNKSKGRYEEFNDIMSCLIT